MKFLHIVMQIFWQMGSLFFKSFQVWKIWFCDVCLGAMILREVGDRF